MPELKTSAAIIEFWFSERVSQLWFQSTLEFDQEVCEQFEATYQAGVRGELSDWETTVEGMLALVILFDQLPLNMYRGQFDGFVTERAALECAKRALDKNWDQALTSAQQAFLYMPFMHSEQLSDQDKAIELFAAAGQTENAKYAHHHRDIVQRFGRFPHRNAILGRESTPEELEYLKANDAFLG